MTQHINPGAGTTINPVVKPNKWFLVNDIEMREFFNAWMYSSKSPKQLHEVYDPILARELNHLCGYCERPFDKHNLPCPHLMRTKLGELIVECAHFKPRGPIDWAAHTSAPAHPPEAPPLYKTQTDDDGAIGKVAICLCEQCRVNGFLCIKSPRAIGTPQPTEAQQRNLSCLGTYERNPCLTPACPIKVKCREYTALLQAGRK